MSIENERNTCTVAPIKRRQFLRYIIVGIAGSGFSAEAGAITHSAYNLISHTLEQNRTLGKGSDIVNPIANDKNSKRPDVLNNDIYRQENLPSITRDNHAGKTGPGMVAKTLLNCTSTDIYVAEAGFILGTLGLLGDGSIARRLRNRPR